MQRVSQLALRRLLSPPSAAAAGRRAVPVVAEYVSGGSILLQTRGGGAVAAASGWSGGGSGLQLARRLCTYDERDDRALEEEAEKKFGWILKIFFLGTAGLFSGDNLLLQSISLLCVKDPLFKRMGASRLTRFAVDEHLMSIVIDAYCFPEGTDGRRMKVVEMGGAQELLNVLEGSKDDKTRKEALKALVALSKSEEAARFLDKAGAYAIVSSTPDPKTPEFAEIETYKASLLKAFDELKS
ncbi:hypothetical protein PR202_gb11490 [Eleusine coracana subsp. coracana]|uniref:Uncharacterized protein n=1 Tax=Eleusine coracana subsp. coracana TaxID=191504 RepID=A0AAV5EM33_ELECO|nr:hypothetical protein PR202_gb11490 [Eleusine coracana subsp. coracana]